MNTYFQRIHGRKNISQTLSVSVIKQQGITGYYRIIPFFKLVKYAPFLLSYVVLRRKRFDSYPNWLIMFNKNKDKLYLCIKRKIFNIHFTRTYYNSWWQPYVPSRRIYNYLCFKLIHSTSTFIIGTKQMKVGLLLWLGSKYVWTKMHREMLSSLRGGRLVAVARYPTNENK